VSYLDAPGSLLYSCSKFGVRGLMRSLRLTSQQHGVRVNLIAPGRTMLTTALTSRYIKTNIGTKAILDFHAKRGTEYASHEDAQKAVLRIAADSTVNGM
jgi:NAD(P)-dependent dehydrogenase (short-subunit alcohol dehydrogenase family)